MSANNADTPRPNALENAAEIASRAHGRRPVVFLDYDGTLTPIVARPELAILSEDMRATLRNLAHIFTTAIVSGRACADVRKLVGIEELFYAGNHGMEIDGPSGTSMRHELGRDYQGDVHAFAGSITQSIGEIDGLLVEDKGFSLSVHYRLVDPGRVAEIESAVDRTLDDFPRLHKRHGKKVFEVRPSVAWDKGKAVSWLLEVIAPGDGLPIYIGDDETDEDAFKALAGRGLSARVGAVDEPTTADYLLADTAEVQRFLEMLINELGAKA